MSFFKYIFLFFFTISYVYGVQLVPMSKKNIKYKEKIYSQDVYFIEASEKYNCKEYLVPSLLKQNLYHAKRYILKNKPICQKDALYKKKNVVRFRFGNLIIEKEGELYKETDEYIKIKNSDGKITKIYKDGKTR
jgi:choline kinase